MSVIHLFHAFSGPLPDTLPVVDIKGQFASHVAARTSCIVMDGMLERTWDIEGPILTMKVRELKGSKPGTLFSHEMTYRPGKRDALVIRGKVSFHPGTRKISLLSYASSGQLELKPDHHSPEEIARIAVQLYRHVPVIVGHGDGTPLDLDELIECMAQAAVAHQQRLTSARSTRMAEIERRTALANRLPDGTPLQIRTGRYDSVWQIGIKNGPVPRDLADKIRIITPEILKAEASQSLGISFHHLLPLVQAAKYAAAAVPEMIEFDPPWEPVNPPKINSQMPFHSRMTGDLGRKPTTGDRAIWAQTSNCLGMTYGNVRKPATNRAFPANSRLSFPAAGVKVPDMEFVAIGDVGGLKDFSKHGNEAIILSDETASILKGFSLGRTEIRPLPVRREDGSLAPGWNILIMREDRPSIDMGRCSQPMINHWIYHTFQDGEIVVDGQAHGDLDLWHDSRIADRPLFFSDRLVKALTKARRKPHISLKKAYVR